MPRLSETLDWLAVPTQLALIEAFALTDGESLHVDLGNCSLIAHASRGLDEGLIEKLMALVDLLQVEREPAPGSASAPGAASPLDLDPLPPSLRAVVPPRAAPLQLPLVMVDPPVPRVLACLPSCLSWPGRSARLYVSTQEVGTEMRIALRTVVVVALLSLSASGLVAQTPEEVTFTHQIRQFVMRGDDTDKIDVTLTFNADALVMTSKKKGATPLTIPYATISGMNYDRRSRVRKMAHNWGKAEDHFLTVQYKPESGPGDFIEIEMGKNTAPRVLATLEARSGKKIERSSGS